MFEQKRWLATAAAVIAAGSLGFSLARWTASPPPLVPPAQQEVVANLKLDPKQITAAGS